MEERVGGGGWRLWDCCSEYRGQLQMQVKGHAVREVRARALAVLTPYRAAQRLHPQHVSVLAQIPSSEPPRGTVRGKRARGQARAGGLRVWQRVEADFRGSGQVGKSMGGDGGCRQMQADTEAQVGPWMQADAEAHGWSGHTPCLPHVLSIPRH